MIRVIGIATGFLCVPATIAALLAMIHSYSHKTVISARISTYTASAAAALVTTNAAMAIINHLSPWVTVSAMASSVVWAATAWMAHEAANRRKET